MANQEITITDIIRAVTTQKLLAVVIFMATLIAVGAATLLSPKYFRSEAKLFARLGRENVGLDATATMGEGSTIAVPMTRESEINSIAEAIMSRQVMERIVDEIGPRTILKPHRAKRKGNATDGDEEPTLIDQLMGVLTSVGIVNDLSPRERAILRLEKKIKVEAVERTNVVEVSFISRDAEASQAVVQSLVKHYLDHHREMNRATGAFDFLNDQTDLLAQELSASESALSKLKTDGRISTIEESGNVRAARAGRIKDSLMQAVAQQEAIQAEVEQLNEQLDSMSMTQVVETTTGAGNEGVDGMRQQLFSLEIRREQLLSEYQPSHPMVRQVEEQLKRATERLRGEEGNRTEQRLGPNTVYLETRKILVQQIAALKAQNALVTSLRQQLDEVNKDLAEFGALEMQHNQIKREVEVQTEAYRKFHQSLVQARLDDALNQSRISNISVAQPATLNNRPAFPNKLLNLLAGIALGGFNALAICVFRWIRKDQNPSATSAPPNDHSPTQQSAEMSRNHVDYSKEELRVTAEPLSLKPEESPPLEGPHHRIEAEHRFIAPAGDSADTSADSSARSVDVDRDESLENHPSYPSSGTRDWSSYGKRTPNDRGQR